MERLLRLKAKALKLILGYLMKTTMNLTNISMCVYIYYRIVVSVDRILLSLEPYFSYISAIKTFLGEVS